MHDIVPTYIHVLCYFCIQHTHVGPRYYSWWKNHATVIILAVVTAMIAIQGSFLGARIGLSSGKLHGHV